MSKRFVNSCELVRNVMDFILNLVQLFKFSPKRLFIFESLRHELSINTGETSPSLRMLCPTRWTIRHRSIESILKNYKVLQAELEEIENGNDEYAAKARGLLSSMELFDTFFGLKLAFLLFSAAEQFSINLQAKDLTIQEAIRGAHLLCTHLTSLRTTESFSTFYATIRQESENLTEEPTLPRYRRAPKRVDGGGSTHRYPNPIDRYRHIYFEALELATGEVKRRFDQEDLFIIREMEDLLIKSSNGEKISDISEKLQNYFTPDIDQDRLKCQLSLLSDMIKSAFQNQVQMVTNVRTIVEAMNKSEIYKGMLTEVYKMLQIYFTFPVTTSTAERSFSSLDRIKTYLRSSMTECRLNNLFLLYVHCIRTDRLDLEVIAKDFICVNSRRMKYFGKF